MALFVLCALGWDIVTDIAFAFQIHRSTFRYAGAAKAADFALKDDQGLCAIGEAKQWDVTKLKWENGFMQIKEYQQALGTPRAFLTCGKRWVVLDEHGNISLDVSIDERVRDATGLVARLEPFLGKGRFGGQVTNRHRWSYGISPPNANPLLSRL